MAIVAVLAGAVGLGIAMWPHPDSVVDPETLVETTLTRQRGAEIQPSFSPDGSQVAYAAKAVDDEFWNIYVEVLDSGQPSQLTNTPEDDVAPAWSPDGRSIAFVRKGLLETDNSLIIISAGGGPERPIASFERRLGFVGVTWSPDGKWLAFSGRPASEGPLRIGLVSAVGGDIEWLTDPEERMIGDGMPAFSSDGARLAFVRRAGSTSGLNIFALSLSADYRPVGKAVQLTDFERAAVAPVWMPGDTEILFLGERGSGQEGIWSVLASGAGEPKLLWRRIGVEAGNTDAGLTAVRNAAGELQIGYSMEGRDDSADIYRVDLTGPAAGNATPFISTTGRDARATYSPDGLRVAYQTGSPTREIWVCDSDAGNRRQLTDLGSRVVGPIQWSPDGRRVAFHARPSNAADVYVVNAETGGTERLTRDPADDAIPFWSRDGRWIYYTSTQSGDWAVWKMPVTGGEPTLLADQRARTIVESWDGRTLYVNDPEARVWRFTLDGGSAEPSLVLESASSAIGGIHVTRSALFFVSQEGMLRRYDLETGDLADVFPVTGALTGVHPDETSVLLTVYTPVESDLKMLKENADR